MNMYSEVLKKQGYSVDNSPSLPLCIVWIGLLIGILNINLEYTVLWAEEAPVFMTAWGTIDLSSPKGVAMDKGGNIYVTEHSDIIIKINNDGQTFLNMGRNRGDGWTFLFP